jgi:hypothetical protein
MARVVGLSQYAANPRPPGDPYQLPLGARADPLSPASAT